MNKKKFGFLAFVVIFIVLVFFFLSVINKEGSGCSVSPKVNEYHAVVSLQENGDMEVIESFVTSGFQEEFYRDFSYRKYNSNNNVYYQSPSNTAFIDINDVVTEVFNDNGEDITSKVRITPGVSCEPSSSSCSSIKTSVITTGDFTSETTFKYTYTIEKAATKYTDISEINWILFNSSNFKVRDVSITVNLPKGTYSLTDDNFYTYCYGTSKGDWEKDFANKAVKINAKKMQNDEEVEFRILIPNEAFPGITESSTNYVDNDNVNKKIIVDYSEELVRIDNKRITAANILFYGTFVLLALMIFITIRVYTKYDKEYKPKFELEIYRELPREYGPAVMGYMYRFMKSDDEDVTATLMDLIRRKYLILDQNNSNINDDDPNFKIIITNKDQSALTNYERHLINWFINTIGDGQSVTLNDIEAYPKKYANAERFQSDGRAFSKLVKDECSKYDFFENVKTGKAKAASFILIPIVYAIIVFLVSSSLNLEFGFALISSIVISIAYGLYIGTIKKRSKNGIEEYAMWKAFRQFLIDFTNLKDYPMPSLTIWEHYMVYAISFGIADKVMEQLKVKLPMDEAEIANTTYMGYGYGRRNFYYGYTFGRLNRSISTARTNGYNTIAAHNASRSGGSGRSGGFGGGSSFGGGGGGIRGR